VVIFENVTLALRAMSSGEKLSSLPGGELMMRSTFAAQTVILDRLMGDLMKLSAARSMESGGPTLLLNRTVCTILWGGEFSISCFCHAFMKADLCVSIKDYPGNKLRGSSFRPAP
jgi:hypothetical protein